MTTKFATHSFSVFQAAVDKQFASMQNKSKRFFTVNIDKDELYDFYLASFPEGTNPIYKNHSEYDCSCCKNFIRELGRVVTLDAKGNYSTIWDGKLPEDSYYKVVAKAMSEKVKSLDILAPYIIAPLSIIKGNQVGNGKTSGLDVEGQPRFFYHFETKVGQDIQATRGKSAEYTIGIISEQKQMIQRALTEIKLDDVETVEDLITSNAIYRGQEHASAVKEFKKALKDFSKVENPDEKWFWVNSEKYAHVSRFRNSVIGSLVSDIAKGKELTDAVASFEAKVAPENYKRTSAIITPKQAEAAKQKLTELGLLDSLSRRFAVQDDISVNNVLFTDNVPSKVEPDDVFDSLSKDVKKVNPKQFDKIGTVSFDKFIKDILPGSTAVEVMFDNSKVSRLMSLTTESVKDSGQLFAWKSPVAWAYKGGLADSSIKELVKKAGGSIEGDIRISLSWHNNDDLDLHVIENAGEEIYYGNRRSRAGGVLDLDMNGMDGLDKNRQPVENVIYKSATNVNTLMVTVHNFSKRESIDRDFEVEIDILGETKIFKSNKPLGNRETIKVAQIVRTINGFVVNPLPGFEMIATATKEVWGVKVGDFVPVKMILESPNFWEGEANKGNHHVFFILKDCINDEPTRGFFNEYLRPELHEHRKSFEMLGDKTKVKESSKQLSGIGLSSTVKEDMIVKVVGATTKIIKVTLN